jgi:SWI/SNF-related matrix-associated actin-dependent regulator 1 of chromatin subfamily A
MDMGLGKSLTTSFSVVYLEAFPCIIVCPKSAMYVWEGELRNWFGMDSTIYVGKPKERKERLKEFKERKHNFIITNYSLIEELSIHFGILEKRPNEGSVARGTAKTRYMPHPPGTGNNTIKGLIADEIHGAGLMNHKAKTYDIFKHIMGEIQYGFLLTGTPARKGCIDFYGPLSLVAPEEFDNYWRFISKYCVVIKERFGTSIERNPQDIIAFRAMLREYAGILKKEDYLTELPGKIRMNVPVELDEEQRRVYDELTAEMFTITDKGELIITPSKLTLLMRQRQLVVAPQILGLKTRGASIDTLIEMTADLVAENKQFVVFTPFKKAIPFIKEALEKEYPGLAIYTITGGLTAEEFGREWQAFQKSTRAAALLCVIKSGASFHATVADNAFFLGAEYDFNLDLQAEDRLNRMGQKKLVHCHYITGRGTVDEEIAKLMNDKKYAADLLLSAEELFKLMLKKHPQYASAVKELKLIL